MKVRESKNSLDFELEKKFMLLILLPAGYKAEIGSTIVKNVRPEHLNQKVL